jgi:hypothetical protein
MGLRDTALRGCGQSTKETSGFWASVEATAVPKLGGIMAQFRKKPVVIEAVQWHRVGDHPAVKPATMPQAAGLTPGVLWRQCGWIKTLEGGHVVNPGDWIITGVKGEMYPCKPDIFEAIYEAV